MLTERSLIWQPQWFATLVQAAVIPNSAHDGPRVTLILFASRWTRAIQREAPQHSWSAPPDVVISKKVESIIWIEHPH